MKYSIRGYSSKSHKKKRVKQVKLPEFNRLVEVYPESINGNEKINIRVGEFISETEYLLFLKPKSKSPKIEAFIKTDIINRIYSYNYLN